MRKHTNAYSRKPRFAPVGKRNMADALKRAEHFERSQSW